MRSLLSLSLLLLASTTAFADRVACYFPTGTLSYEGQVEASRACPLYIVKDQRTGKRYQVPINACVVELE